MLTKTKERIFFPVTSVMSISYQLI